MKKILAFGLISLAFAQAKVLVGVHGSYDLGATTEATGKFSAPIWNGNTEGGWGAGAHVGMQHGSDLIGVRYFLSFDYSQALAAAAKGLSVYDIDANVDLLLNFVRGGGFGMGLFVGAGAGYQYVSMPNDSLGNLPIFARAGLMFNFGERSSLDLGVKVPLTAIALHKSAGLNDAYWAPLKIQVGYTFSF